MRKKYSFPGIILLYIMLAEPIVSFSQFPKKYEATQGFVAHEWGTFTTLRRSDGRMLSGLQLEEERLPDFVYNLCECFQFYSYKGYAGIYAYALKNVTVKMETPVLYFYTSEPTEKAIDVKVNFKNGSISQWYPNRSNGEIMSFPVIHSTSTIVEPPPQILDFSLPVEGWIQWKAHVLPAGDLSTYTNDPAWETPIWKSPRTTQSNLVKIKKGLIKYNQQTHVVDSTDQIEKFLFYRGIGNFTEPIRIEFNSQENLLITNLGESLSYMMIYEKRKDGKVVIWASDSLPANQKKLILKPAGIKIIDPGVERENFVAKLVAAGLYEDEARAMLTTWQQSYFEHEGLKVFWIVPRKFTDKILPLRLDPQPNTVNRVMVGRSEILTPEFERQLAGQPDSVLNKYYAKDRFRLAYLQLVDSGIPNKWTDEGKIPDIATPNVTQTATYNPGTMEVFPNPVSGSLTVVLGQATNIKIFSSRGALVMVMENAKIGKNNIDIEMLPAGIYVVKAEHGDGSFHSKKIVKE